MSQNFRQCIFSSYCTNKQCDLACSRNAMSQLLLEKSEITINNLANSADLETKKNCHSVIQNSFGKFQVILNHDPVNYADVITYTGICDMCEGHGSNVSVYHLKYSKYIQMLKDSWTYGNNIKLRECQAFLSSAKLVVISGLDYMLLKDFECQTLLSLLQDRNRLDMATVVVTRSISSLNGGGVFFTSLKELLKSGLREASGQ